MDRESGQPNKKVWSKVAHFPSHQNFDLPKSWVDKNTRTVIQIKAGAAVYALQLRCLYFLSWSMKPTSTTTQMKSTEGYLPVVLFTILYNQSGSGFFVR